MVVPSHHPSPSMSKPELRAAMRAARKAFVASLDSVARDRLQDALAAVLCPLIQQATVVASFAPIGGEIDPASATRACKAATIAYPAFASRDAPMHFRAGECTETCPLVGIQPPSDAPAVAPDLVLVPLLAVDASGNRLGQGGGHYDRALPALRRAGARIVGVGWSMQRLDFRLQADEWDVPLDAFASPAGLETFE